MKISQLSLNESVIDGITRWVANTSGTVTKWFHDEDLSVYLRYDSDSKVATVVSITVQPPSQGRGTYSAFLKKLEQLPINAVVIEYVQDLEQEHLYLRRGYERYADNPAPTYGKKLVSDDDTQ